MILFFLAGTSMVEPWFPVDFPLDQPNERLGSKPAKIARCSACRVGRAVSTTPGFLPSGKRLHNYGKSPFSMGRSTINHHFQ